MNNNVMKLMLCVGFVSGTSFGMEKKAIELPGKLFVETDTIYSFKYEVIAEDGSRRNVSDEIKKNIRSLKRFQGGSFTLKDFQYYAQGDNGYASYIAVNRENIVSNRTVNPTVSDFLVPVECTQKQLKELVRLRQENRDKVFVIGRHNSRLDIETISCDVEDITHELQLERAEKRRIEVRESYEYWKKCQRQRDMEACTKATILIGCLCLVMIGAHFGA